MEGSVLGFDQEKDAGIVHHHPAYGSTRTARRSTHSRLRRRHRHRKEDGAPRSHCRLQESYNSFSHQLPMLFSPVNLRFSFPSFHSFAEEYDMLRALAVAWQSIKR